MGYEYLVVLPIEPLPRGARYPRSESLPLHCTLMPWFRMGEHQRISFKRMLAELGASVPSDGIELHSVSRELFGPNTTIPVDVLERNPDLMLLHTRLLLRLASWDAAPRELRWIGAGYRPHATVRGLGPHEWRHQAIEMTLVERNARSKRAVWSTALGGR